MKHRFYVRMIEAREAKDARQVLGGRSTSNPRAIWRAGCYMGERGVQLVRRLLYLVRSSDGFYRVNEMALSPQVLIQCAVKAYVETHNR